MNSFIKKMPFAIKKMYFLYFSFLSGHLALHIKDDL